MCKSFFFFQIAALVTLPFDVVKTHQQIELGEKEIYTGWQHSINGYNFNNLLEIRSPFLSPIL